MIHLTNTFSDSIQSVELDWFAEGDVVRVTPRNQMRFDIQKDRAIEILQLAKDADRFQLQFRLLLNRLAAWICRREEGIANAFVTLQDGTLAFVVVRRAARYEEQFQDDLAELDFEIANDADLELIKLKTLALPHVTEPSLRSFLDQRLILSYHGKRSGPHTPGESQPSIPG